MSDTVSGADAPMWLRIVAVLGLLWNLVGCYMYLGSVGLVGGSDPAMAAAVLPAWVTGAFAIAVFAGALGCLGLLLLRRWSVWMLGLSLLGVLAHHLWVLLFSGLAMGNGAPLAIAVIVIAIVLFWFAYSGGTRGWLR